MFRIRSDRPYCEAVLDVLSTDDADANPPFAVQIEITSRCNLSCKMCPLTTGGTASVLHAGHISDEIWDELMSVARHTKQVFVAGFGEPFVNPRAVNLLRQLDDAGVKTSIVTNGVALTERIARELTSMAHVVHINVSIDSPDPDVYQTIRGGRLANALRGLENLMSAIDNPQRVSVSSVAMSENLDSLHGFPPLLERLGVRNYVLQGLVDYNDYSSDRHLPSSTGIRRAIDGLRADCISRQIAFVETIPDRFAGETADPTEPEHRSAIRVRVPRSDRRALTDPRLSRQCMLPWEVPYVDKDGTVFACCYAASSNDRPLGRLGEHRLAEIWRAEPYRQFRRDLLSGSGLPRSCQSCTAVPLGPHPLHRFRAAVVRTSVHRGRLTVVARNDGDQPWTAATPIRLGTAAPRDGASPLWTTAWLSENRAAGLAEHQVAPGQQGTFRVRLNRGRLPLRGDFELVADGVCWIPGTRFAVAVPRLGLPRLVARRLQRLFHRPRRILPRLVGAAKAWRHA
jgi:radical SAM protein with 4Fe4S-binding SPASM domain